MQLGKGTSWRTTGVFKQQIVLGLRHEEQIAYPQRPARHRCDQAENWVVSSTVSAVERKAPAGLQDRSETSVIEAQSQR